MDLHYQHALDLFRTMLGTQAEFRPGQWEAIEAVAIKRQRALVVQRTGWGKSLVHFLATKLLREQGVGPTLLISPLLSLMRNQIDMAARIGIRAYTIHSMPAGNRLLLEKGAHAFPHPFREPAVQLSAWLEKQAGEKQQPRQLGLF